MFILPLSSNSILNPLSNRPNGHCDASRFWRYGAQKPKSETRGQSQNASRAAIAPGRATKQTGLLLHAGNSHEKLEDKTTERAFRYSDGVIERPEAAEDWISLVPVSERLLLTAVDSSGRGAPTIGS